MGLFLKTKKYKIDKFWSWFKDNEELLFNFERDQEKIFDKLSEQLSLIDGNLTFEFSSVHDSGKRDFVISADGIKSSFQSVEELATKAPIFDRWTIIKYRPRRKTLNEIKFQGKHVDPKDVYFAIFKDDNPDKIGIMVFLKDYKETEKDTWGQIGYLILDEVLGEYDTETKVGAIGFQSTNSKDFEYARPIDELQSYFDSRFQINL